MQHHATEVLVVGAGPVGMFAALSLAQNGVNVSIIDEESRTAGRSYACALHPRTLELLSEVGVAADAIELGRTVNSVGFYADGSRRAELKLGEMPWKFPFALVLEQTKLEDLLEQKLRRVSNAGVSWNHRLADVKMHAAGVTADIEKLAMTAKGYGSIYMDLTVEKEIQARADFVIGADGHNSMVRRRLNIDYEAAGEPELYVVYEAGSNRDCGHEMKIVLDGKTTSVMWPLSGEKCRWSFQLLPADAPEDFPGKDRSRFVVREQAGHEDSQHHLQRLVGQRAPWLTDTIGDVGWCTDIQFERRLAKEFGRERCWLAGDAAHQTCPVGMQSMNVGLREAADLAARLAGILRGKEPANLFETYHAARHGEWERLLGLKGPPRPRAGMPPWVGKWAPRILASLPASGPELTLMLDRLGLEG